MERKTTDDLLRRYREQHQESTTSGNVGAFAVPLGTPLRRVPEPPYEEVPTVKRRRPKKKKR
jgi:hypothetical protein